MSKVDRLFYLLIVFISALFVADLFISGYLPATMDGLIHVETIAQFSDALAQGDFPVIWLNNFANYGLPVGIFSHQLPIYLGAIINLMSNSPVFSTNVVTFIGIVLANVLFYKFLRIYFPELTSFLATVLFILAPYRILNVYIRGAVPESFALLFLPYILICLHRVFSQRKQNSIFLLILGLIGLMLTHPMMVIIYSFIIIPYFIFLLVQNEKDQKNKQRTLSYARASFVFLFSIIFALGVASYYLIPLLIEKKYFYFGHNNTIFNNSFFELINFIDTAWYYSFSSDIFTRGHRLQVGIVESLIMFLSVIIVVRELTIKKIKNDFLLFTICVVAGVFIVFLLLPISSIFYTIFPILQNIQFPWRMLSVFIIIPPILFAFLMHRYKYQWLFFLILLLVIINRVPELYGKNYIDYPISFYHSAKENLHSVNMNTIWSGKTEEYPTRVHQADIVEGKGNLTYKSLSNSDRLYQFKAKSDLKVVDYTFYFPGWTVLVDDKSVPIQFQDPALRGVITYVVPKGEHRVSVLFDDTVVRRVARYISIASIILLLLFFLLRKTVLSKVYKYV